MAVFVRKLIGEPIIAATFDGDVQEPELMNFFAASVSLSSASDRPLYRVLDIRNCAESYAAMVLTLRNLTAAAVGAPVVPDLLYVFVGEAHMADFFQQVGLVFFTNLDDAKAYVQAQMQPVPEPMAV